MKIVTTSKRRKARNVLTKGAARELMELWQKFNVFGLARHYFCLKYNCTEAGFHFLLQDTYDCRVPDFNTYINEKHPLKFKVQCIRGLRFEAQNPSVWFLQEALLLYWNWLLRLNPQDQALLISLAHWSGVNERALRTERVARLENRGHDLDAYEEEHDLYFIEGIGYVQTVCPTTLGFDRHKSLVGCSVREYDAYRGITKLQDSPRDTTTRMEEQRWNFGRAALQLPDLH